MVGENELCKVADFVFCVSYPQMTLSMLPLPISHAGPSAMDGP